MKLIERFLQGQEVPDWLLVAYLHEPDAKLGEFVFDDAAEVYEHRGQFWVIPESRDRPPIGVHNSHGITLRAVNSDVVFPISFQIMSATPGVGETWHQDD